MKYTLDIKILTILENILFVAEKTAKTVQFCFIKGKKQSYINPQKDILVTFELEDAIKFDYPINNLRTFLARAVDDKNNLISIVIDSDKNKSNKEDLELVTKENIRYFESKSVVQTVDFKHSDLSKVSKFKHTYINFLGEDKEFKLKYQNHVNNWWVNDLNYKEFTIDKSTRKFRYVLERVRLRLYPTDYKLICKRDGVLRFQFKHLNYYFKSKRSWEGVQVKSWVKNNNKVEDEHLNELYKSKGYL